MVNTMDAQQQHDDALAKRKPMTPAMAAELKQHLRAASGAASSAPPTQSTTFDPIANAMERNPGLTRETAEQMADEFGF